MPHQILQQKDLMKDRAALTRFAWLSIGAALTTITLKAEDFEADVRAALGGVVTVFTHPEPVEDEISMDDMFLDR